MVIMDYITEYIKPPTLIIHNVILVLPTHGFLHYCLYNSFFNSILKMYSIQKHHIEASLDTWINEV
jgi:hypothetical protein